ncbi:UNVERIFIED_CONTAM: hypothetical protein FKN15_043110 [Acipenser sinensis]
MTKEDSCIHTPTYLQKLPASSNDNVVCPDVNIFMDKSDSHEFLWYKDCKPINGNRYRYENNMLIIRTVKSEDEGNYTCVVTFSLNGTRYEASRTIHIDVKGVICGVHPTVINPINNTIEAWPGSPFNIVCKVFIGLCGENDLTDVWWEVNDTRIQNSSRITVEKQREILTQTGQEVDVKLIFTDLKEDDFGSNFSCFAVNGRGSAFAYFLLKPAGLF